MILVCYSLLHQFVWCINLVRNKISLTVFPSFITGNMQNNKKCGKANMWSICWKIWHRINWIWKLDTWHSSTYAPRCVISLKLLQWDNNVISSNEAYHHYQKKIQCFFILINLNYTIWMIKLTCNSKSVMYTRRSLKSISVTRLDLTTFI